MSRNRIVFLFIAFYVGTLAFGQDKESVADVYQRNFIRASLSTKLELLKEAAAYTDVDMGPLYGMALQFVFDNGNLLDLDLTLRNIAIFSAQRIETLKYRPSASVLLAILLNHRDSQMRVPILSALAAIGPDNRTVVEGLNEFLATQNALFRDKVKPDYAVLLSTVSSLGRIGDGASFPVLFSTLSLGYSADVSMEVSKALASLKGDYKAFILSVIERNPPEEKASALKAAMESDRFPPDDRAMIAETALSVGLTFSTPNTAEREIIRGMRLQAVKELNARKWQRATPYVIKHFQEVLTEWNRGMGLKSSLLEAIACLGAMGTNDAAQTLIVYLQYVNTETDRGKNYDEQLTTALIYNLGLIGDKIAYNDLLYMSYLKYPESVKKMAREALAKLK